MRYINRRLRYIITYKFYIVVLIMQKTIIVGVVGVIWAITWFFLVYDSPAQHPRITVEEREYIEKALNKKTETKVVGLMIVLHIHPLSSYCHCYVH